MKGIYLLEFHQLEYFRMVCQLQHFSNAAERLHVSQPSVTVAIRKLEEELGIQLLDRSQKRIAVTPEGRVFLQRVEEILGKVKDAVIEMNDYRQMQKGAVKVGITPIMGAVLFPFAFAHFQKQFPNLNITVMEEGSLAIRNRLEQGELDVGILIISDMPPRLQTVPITRGQILVCLPPDHPLGSHDRIPFQALNDQPLIMFREDTYSRKIILEECAKFGFTPNIVFSSNQIETIMELVKQGVGISFFIEEIVRRQPDILSRPLLEPLYLVAGIAWSKERYLAKAAQTFIDSFRETLQSAGTLS
jgi:DNA-binding transcriptional LysR family regulator